MSTIISHPAIPVALSAVFPSGTISSGLLMLGVVCSIMPDLDVIGFGFGIRYGDVLGHRGFSHSVLFATLLSALLASLWPHGEPNRFLVFMFLFLSTLSHPFLDALTDGGLGVAWFAPFSNKRYFFPWRPIAVPPIGILPFFSAWGWQVMKSEIAWIWLPSAAVFAAGHVTRRLW